MSSDHWNFLANLLGTPGPNDPKGKKKKKAESEQVGPPEPAQSEPQEPESSIPSEPVAKAAPPEPMEETSADDVLDALTAAVPAQSLPGFGQSSTDPELTDLTEGAPPAEAEPVVPSLLNVDRDSTAADALFSEQQSFASAPKSMFENETGEQESSGSGAADETDELDEANEDLIAVEAGPDDEDSGEIAQDDLADQTGWQSLADELGVSPGDELPPHREPKSFEKRAVKSESPKPKRSAGSGFGSGLGIDLGPEPVEEDDLDNVPDPVLLPPASIDDDIGWDDTDDEEPEEAIAQEDEAEPSVDLTDPLAFTSFSQFDNEPAEQPQTEESPDFVSRDSWNDAPAPRGSSAKSARAVESRKDDPRREGHSFRTERDSEEDTPKRRRRRRGVRQQMDAEAPVSEESPFLEVAHDDDVEKDDRYSGKRRASSEESDGEEQGRRSRRRGRRGRGRRERLEDDEPLQEANEFDLDPDLDLDDDDPVEAVEVDDEDQEDEPRKRRRRRGRRGRGGRGRKSETAESQRNNSDDDEIGWEDEDKPESAFDDDHEDDDEVEVIRRGRRRSSGRGRDRDGRERERKERDGQERKVRSRDEDERPTKSSSRERAGASEDGPKRKPVPTWTEVVNLLVDNNVKNHKKSNKRGSRGRRKPRD